jgi:spermidine synthase
VTRRTLSSGREAVAELGATGWTLRVGGFVQSHVGDPSQPPELASVQWMLAAAIEALGERSGATALHLGAGAATLPRALQHRDPTMRQRVVELEPAIVDLVAEVDPVPRGVRLEVGDGRAALEATTEPASLVVIDVFDGGRVPAAFTTVECFRAARAALEPGGTLVINSVDGPPAHFVRAQLATLRAVFAHVAMITRGSTIAVRQSNIVLLASDAPLPIEAIHARVHRGERPASAIGGARIGRFIADTAPAPVTDATSADRDEPVLTRYSAPGALPASLTDPLD